MRPWVICAAIVLAGVQASAEPWLRSSQGATGSGALALLDLPSSRVAMIATPLYANDRRPSIARVEFAFRPDASLPAPSIAKFAPTPSKATSPDRQPARSEKFWSARTLLRIATRAGKLAIGWTLGYAVHEAAHLAAGKVVGVSGYLQGGVVGGTLIFRGAGGEQGQRIASAGFLGQAVGTELVLHNRLYERSDIARGFLLFNLTNGVMYVAANELGPKRGDLDFFERSGGATSNLYAFILAHTALSLLRMHMEIPAEPWFVFTPDRSTVGMRFRF